MGTQLQLFQPRVQEGLHFLPPPPAAAVGQLTAPTLPCPAAAMNGAAPTAMPAVNGAVNGDVVVQVANNEGLMGEPPMEVSRVAAAGGGRLVCAGPARAASRIVPPLPPPHRRPFRASPFVCAGDVPV